MTFEKFLELITKISPWLIVKLLTLILLVFYCIFSVVLYRQVGLMNQTLEAKFSPVLRLVSLIHLAIVIVVFLIAALFL